MTTFRARARICFIEIMGVPGSCDASVYEDPDREGSWFVKRYGHIPGIALSTANPCLDESLPEADAVDGVACR